MAVLVLFASTAVVAGTEGGFVGEPANLLKTDLSRTSIKAVSQANPACSAALSQALALHVPALRFNDSFFWIDLQYGSANDGNVMMKLTNYGPLAQDSCGIDSTYLVESEGRYIIHIPSVEYAGAYYWLNFEYVPTNDGLIWLKLTRYGSADGQSGEEGAFIATAKAEILSETDLEFKIRSVFPVGIEAEIAYMIQPNQTYSNATSTHSNVTEDSFEFNLSYFLPYSVLPSNVAARLQGLSSASASFVGKTADTGQSGVKVVAQGVMEKAGKKAVEAMAEKGFGETGGKVAKVGGTALDVMSAWNAHNNHLDWMERLDKMEDCVNNPLNPIDQDPTLKQPRLDKINATRSEIKHNTGVKFINKIVSGVSGLTPARAVWPIIAGAKRYTDNAMKEINDSLVADLEKEMPKCERSYTGWITAKNTMDEDYIDVASLQNITWKQKGHIQGDYAYYDMSAAGTVEVIIRGSAWEGNCDPVDQYLHNIQFKGSLIVFDAERSDQYDNRYFWMISPTAASLLQCICPCSP